MHSLKESELWAHICQVRRMPGAALIRQYVSLMSIDLSIKIHYWTSLCFPWWHLFWTYTECCFGYTLHCPLLSVAPHIQGYMSISMSVLLAVSQYRPSDRLLLNTPYLAYPSIMCGLLKCLCQYTPTHQCTAVHLGCIEPTSHLPPPPSFLFLFPWYDDDWFLLAMKCSTLPSRSLYIRIILPSALRKLNQ